MVKVTEVTGARRGYQAFELSDDSRSSLAKIFPPKFPEFIGHHITHLYGAMSDEPLPAADTFQVVGYTCDDTGLEALVIEVDGSHTRPDGKIYHCTWSLDREAGFKPVDSNKVLSEQGWDRLSKSINIHAVPKFF